MPWRAIGLLITALLSWSWPRAVRAEPPRTFALVVGANQGGQGQAPLRYAAEDAAQVARLLAELGRTAKDDTQLLLQPTPQDILTALGRLRERLATRAQAGEYSKLIFYYSGHARARALSLEGGELPLEALRRELLSLPSTLTVVVLDACQSGAFSGVKGAVPAADFATSSISDLNNQGVAVMASSTAAELSQESPDLSASYFTHHLLTGLRGAADRDADGSVSLDEAYAYAYRNTLSDTLRTRVGSQHATLEMELKGYGQVPLTYTVDADAQLRLPARVEGRVVVQRQGRGAVLAELEKPRGSLLALALPHGDYEVLVRASGTFAPRACVVRLPRGAVQELDTRACPTVEAPALLAAKGAAAPFERWFVEIGAARHFVHDDAYVDTLAAFRFRNTGDYVMGDDPGSFMPWLGGGLGLTRHWGLLARFEGLQKRAFERHLQTGGGASEDASFSWRSWAFSLGARARLPLLDERIVPFAEAGLGLGLARSKYQNSGQSEDVQLQAGPVLRVELGATFHLFWRIGALLSGGYAYAPVLANEIGQTHDDGGFSIALGLRVRGLREGGRRGH